MKKSVKIFFAALLLPLVLGVLACGKTEVPEEETHEAFTPLNAEDLYGTWKGTGNEISTVSFGQNGYYLDDAGDISMEGTYFVDTIEHEVIVTEKEYGMTFTYHVDLSGDNLTLQVDGGLPRTFIRK